MEDAEDAEDVEDMEPDKGDGFIGAHITLRVSRDGGRTWGPRTTYRPSREAAPLESAGRFPPCRCPRCRRS
ncbi:hypothetical protein [Streptomyces sp. NPDC046197]|uniref:hypothetical protein n=1 Tax=Streptomyces sp. NPDC046197 TaxID=3154337 RepID=UPI0033E69ADE